MSNALAIARALSCEIAILLGAFALLAADLVWLRRRTPRSRMLLLGSAAIALLAATGAYQARLLIPSAAPILAALEHGLQSLAPGHLVLNPLTILLKEAVLVVAAFTILISLGYPFTAHVSEYLALILFATLGMLFLCTAQDLLMIYLALELTSLTLYALTGFHKGERRSAEAAVKYFLFGALCSALLLYGLSYLYGLTGTTSLAGIRAALESTAAGEAAASPILITLAIAFTLAGFAFKIAAAPFHFWAPDAYEGAPAPVTAFLASGSKLVAFFVLFQLLTLGLAPQEGAATAAILPGTAAGARPGWALLVAMLACVTMVWGNCAAIVQTNLKRLLAYSSIAHAGYVLVAVVAANRFGLLAVVYYAIIYALTNLGAFGIVAALSGPVGGDSLDHFRGVARRAPFLSLLMVLFVLSLAGIPPLAGFFGKYLLFAAALDRDPDQFGLLWIVAVAVVTSAVSLYYYLIIFKRMYICAADDETPIRTPLYLNLGLGLLALLVLGLGVLPAGLLGLIERTAAAQGGIPIP